MSIGKVYREESVLFFWGGGILKGCRMEKRRSMQEVYYEFNKGA
jgi:hypothetical protein